MPTEIYESKDGPSRGAPTKLFGPSDLEIPRIEDTGWSFEDEKMNFDTLLERLRSSIGCSDADI